MGLNKDNRLSISFSDNGDADLIPVINGVRYNLSGFCKDLMRDGLKYRELMPVTKPPKKSSVTIEPTLKVSIEQRGARLKGSYRDSRREIDY